ncbi:hypothetical protein FB440_101130 [Vibrio crassostreae]|nr:hypothetical protein EDB67_10980 [Vibrio crassostreae]TCV29229.1 hypothetical protein EDB71_10499 [Vibrio crassostreae]TCW20201.1 hypothetical protein EDB48_104147 [Vibrio crassostreae]TWD43217.1 hypothetical protein FB440_101130 [Vibrio crassostreae]CAK1725728.1 hypothetical protein VCRA2113O409_110140 [Vibrio crassostreae]
MTLYECLLALNMTVGVIVILSIVALYRFIKLNIENNNRH